MGTENGDMGTGGLRLWGLGARGDTTGRWGHGGTKWGQRMRTWGDIGWGHGGAKQGNRDTEGQSGDMGDMGIGECGDRGVTGQGHGDMGTKWGWRWGDIRGQVRGTGGHISMGQQEPGAVGMSLSLSPCRGWGAFVCVIGCPRPPLSSWYQDMGSRHIRVGPGGGRDNGDTYPGVTKP